MPEMLISTDKSKLDRQMIIEYLQSSYWAKTRSAETIKKSIEHSMCFAVYSEGKQIGFTRVVSDQSVFAYLMDVFILEEYQGNGYGKALMQAIMQDPDLVDVENWFLRTMDAQGLYQQFGFTELEFPERTMAKRNFII
ncbi:MAG: GNAT family N-acetyltransferase [Crocinitomicaceae bacterium]|nr:GNAT family N-acetyltransferase [Crocinitomicaceae bacterium]